MYLDAIYPKVRSAGRVVSLAVLVALGVKDTGEKVLLSLMRLAAILTEKAVFLKAFRFWRPHNRDGSGGCVRMLRG